MLISTFGLFPSRSIGSLECSYALCGACVLKQLSGEKDQLTQLCSLLINMELSSTGYFLLKGVICMISHGKGALQSGWLGE